VARLARASSYHAGVRGLALGRRTCVPVKITSQTGYGEPPGGVAYRRRSLLLAHELTYGIEEYVFGLPTTHYSQSKLLVWLASLRHYTVWIRR
jgi:hypothetical protein